MAEAVRRGWKAVTRIAPEERKRLLDLWPAPGPDFEIMKPVKGLFDPRPAEARTSLWPHLTNPAQSKRRPRPARGNPISTAVYTAAFA